jgi:uncharacterized membrane protein
LDWRRLAPGVFAGQKDLASDSAAQPIFPVDLSTVAAADIIALAGFLAAWLGYSLVVDHGPLASRTLSSAMDRERRSWVEMMQSHDVRIADVNILSGLQHGTAFFASASMLAIGACLAVLGSSDNVSAVIEDIVPGGSAAGAALFEAKMIGLAVIFVYAFFKFGWSYRLINYASILAGALPPASQAGTERATLAIDRATHFLRLGGSNFNRGQRAFNFGLAYLCWLAGPWYLLAASALVLLILVHRQFWSRPAGAFKTGFLPQR